MYLYLFMYESISVGAYPAGIYKYGVITSQCFSFMFLHTVCINAYLNTRRVGDVYVTLRVICQTNFSKNYCCYIILLTRREYVLHIYMGRMYVQCAYYIHTYMC